jgi:mannosyltransferase
VALRVWGLPGESLWIDEVYTARAIDGSLMDVLPRVRAEESTPPLYPWLAWAWTRLAGDGDLALRSLSLLFGVAAIPVAFALGRSLSGEVAGLGAAALIAVNPFIVWYSQEARAYALFVLLGLLSLLALIHADRSGGRRATLVWGAICALALGTHHFAAVIVWPEAAWLLWRRRTRLTWLIVAVLGALQAALVALALEQSKNSEFIADQAFGRRLANVPKQFALGQFANQLDSPILVAVAVILVAATAVFVGLSPAGRRAAMPALALAAAITALSVIPAAAGFDRLNGRNLILVLALALVTAGVALTAEGRRGGFVLLGLLVALFTGVSTAVAVTPRLQRDDWKGAARELRALPRPLDVVVTPGAWTPALERYLPGLKPLRAPNEPRLVAYVRVARPPSRLDARVPGLVERERMLLPSAEIVVFDARRRVTPELLAEPVGGTFAASVTIVRR